MKTIAFVRATNIYDDSRATKEIIALAKAGYNIELLAWNRNGKAEESCLKVFESYKGSINYHFYTAGLRAAKSFVRVVVGREGAARCSISVPVTRRIRRITELIFGRCLQTLPIGQSRHTALSPRLET